MHLIFASFAFIADRKNLLPQPDPETKQSSLLSRFQLFTYSNSKLNPSYFGPSPRPWTDPPLRILTRHKADLAESGTVIGLVPRQDLQSWISPWSIPAPGSRVTHENYICANQIYLGLELENLTFAKIPSTYLLQMLVCYFDFIL